MTTWFTADQHFGHVNIIKSCNRPFESVGEMEMAMVTNWNYVVQDKDMVYCLGDMFWKKELAHKYLPLLKGEIHYIPSFEKSHEKGITYQEFGFIHQSLEVIEIENQLIVLCHYPLLSWPKVHYDSWHLHGHSHGRVKPIGKMLDVGVDGHDFYPWAFKEIKKYMEEKRLKNIQLVYNR